ncbi:MULTISPECIES: type IV conjugative transfer system protein TraL [Pseudomonas]|jgi:conjugal transfer pilus assembly protein TraL|uniref:type IV conjugative transfer system protein TraL n=1 Tax=Pseudomonas TaxID=286 RepID=UPI002A1F34BF|nr:type IV conjugative transfer system protein TraL [Pseudomonas putida]
MSSDFIQLPHEVDGPPMLLFWTLDEILPVISMLFVGIVVGKLLPMLILGIIIMHFYQKLLNANPDGLAMHLMYWYCGITVGRKLTIPNPFSREFIQ